MITALTVAAESGVDVRIITPHIPDKWYVHAVSRSYYRQLIDSGVRIYEYTPGFIHGKMFVADDEVATVGTVNMDYRSFYFHFECGVWMCSVPAVDDIKEHFEEMQAESNEIILSKWSKRPLRKRFMQALLNVFAPFM